MNTTRELSGLSKRERSVLQNDGGENEFIGNELTTWTWRISKKVQGTISDVKIMLKFRNDAVNIEPPLLDCREDLIEIRDLIDELLNIS